MRINSPGRGLVFLLPVLLLSGLDLFADGERRDHWQAESNTANTSEEVLENQGGEGIMDSRLPPVIPGEEVIRQGKRIRVISTSGPVPLRERKLNRSDVLQDYPGVIVDMRDRFDDRRLDRLNRHSGERGRRDGIRHRDRNHYLDRRKRR